MNFMITVLVIIFCIIGLLAYGLIVMASPTKGKKVEPYENPKKALLVIDVQEDFTGKTAKSPYKDSERLIAAVNSVIEGAAGKKIEIVYIRNEFENFVAKMISRLLFKGATIKGDPGTRIDERIKIKSELSFFKRNADAFSNQELDAFLPANGVDELYLVGLDAACCVDRTAKGALNRGYKVSIITDAVITQYEKKWDSILKQWEQIGIVLITVKEFLKLDE